MASTITRSFVKGLVWEATSPLVLYAFTREWKVIVGYTAVRVLMYFGYERIWKRIKWGKVKV